MVDQRHVGTTRVGIRELRSAASSWIRRAQAGERIVVTVNGVEVAQLTEMTPAAAAAHGAPTLTDLAVAGLVERPAVGAELLRNQQASERSHGPSLGAVAADIQVDRILAHVRGQQVRSR